MKACTDIPQSKKLAEFLPIESADMWFANGLIVAKTSKEPNDIKGVFPCWSLAALIDVINQVREIKHQRVTILVGRYANEHWYVEILRVQDERSVFLEHSKELVDACYDMIIKLNGLNLL